MSTRFICSGVMRGPSINDLANVECVLDSDDEVKCCCNCDPPLLTTIGSASAVSLFRNALNFLCGLYASSINEFVSYNGGACNTLFSTGISSIDWLWPL